MNHIITRPQRRSRALLGSTMAMLVALPLAATLGIGATASAAAPDREPAPASTSEPATEKSAPADDATWLGDAVPSVAKRALREAAAAEDGSFDALLFSKTAAFRHDTIPVAIAAIQQLGVDERLHGDGHGGQHRVHRRQPRPVRGRHLPVDDR